MRAPFPTPLRGRRRSLVALTLALSAAFTAASVSSAPADELGDKQRRVHHAIDQAQDELRASSRELERATALVDRTERRLEVAKRALETRRSELAAAQVLDAEMQSALDEANARLARAKAALAEGRRSRDAQQEEVRRFAAETYQGTSPELMGLTMVLTARDPAELTNQLSVVRNMMDRESATLDRLEASETLLKLEERQVADSRREVAAKRRAAAESLARTRTLEAQAEAADARVGRLLDERTQAQDEAAAAKRADQRRLDQLEQERNHIETLIRRREAALRARQSRAQLERERRQSYTSSSGLSWPITGVPITSPYGMRLHPVYHRWTLHDGTDFGAGCGTPIHAAAPGRVIARYYNVGYGNRVIIAHGYMNGVSVSTGYNHLSRYASYVGERVSRGQVIGYVGTTGFSTGCHLHFMVFVNGSTVDPMTWLH